MRTRALSSSPRSLRGKPRLKRPSTSIVDWPRVIAGPGDVDVAVLDHQVGRRGAPLDVPGAHPLAGEAALDARPAERAGHRAVEAAGATDGHRPAGLPNAVITAVSHWSLSCQSLLVTWNGSVDRSPHAVVPCSST